MEGLAKRFLIGEVVERMCDMRRIVITITDENDYGAWFGKEQDETHNFTGNWVLTKEETADWPSSLGHAYKIVFPTDVISLMFKAMTDHQISDQDASDFIKDPYEFKIKRRNKEKT